MYRESSSDFTNMPIFKYLQPESELKTLLRLSHRPLWLRNLHTQIVLAFPPEVFKDNYLFSLIPQKSLTFAILACFGAGLGDATHAVQV